jgi:hypothetical protein
VPALFPSDLFIAPFRPAFYAHLLTASIETLQAAVHDHLDEGQLKLITIQLSALSIMYNETSSDPQKIGAPTCTWVRVSPIQISILLGLVPCSCFPCIILTTANDRARCEQTFSDVYRWRGTWQVQYENCKAGD